jgi:GT2 family glycosyltransferase
MKTTAEQAPHFSIIIPTRHRPEALQKCLEAIGRLTYPAGEFEVVVVHDGEDGQLEETVAPFGRNFPLRTFCQPQAGPAQARNSGAAQAKGAYLAFTDDDCTPAPDWLTTLETCFHRFPDSMAGGRIINRLPNNRCAQASQLLVDYLYDFYNANPRQARFFTSNNFAVPHRLFNRLGGFDTTFSLAAGEDRAFCRRWLQEGYGMIYEPAAVVYHAHNLTLNSYWQQHFNYGRGAFRFRRLNAQQTHQRLQLENKSFYLNLLRYPLKHSPRLPLLFLFVVMQLANTAGFLYEWTRLARIS